MFAKETSKKEQREDKGQQEEGPEDEAQLVKMIARLTLQYEFERMATARAENVALEFEANNEVMVATEASKEAYGAEGEKARKTSVDQFKGHQTRCSGCWHFGWRHQWSNKRTTWTGLWEP